MKKLITIIFVLILPMQMFAQNQDSAAFSKVLKMRAREIVYQLNEHIEQMTKPKATLDVRRKVREAALNLFVAQGREFVSDNNGEKKVVKAECSTVRNGLENTRPVKDYFTRIENLMMHGAKIDVKITEAEVCFYDSSKTKILGDGVYEHTYFIPDFGNPNRWEGHYIIVKSYEMNPPLALLVNIKVAENN